MFSQNLLEKEVNNLSNETHIQYKIEFSIIKDGKVYNDGSVIKQEIFWTKILSFNIKI